MTNCDFYCILPQSTSLTGLEETTMNLAFMVIPNTAMKKIVKVVTQKVATNLKLKI